MKPGQWRVVVLLAALLALELVLQPNVKQWAQTSWANINGGLTASSTGGVYNPIASVPFLGGLNALFNSNLGKPKPTGLPTQNVARPIGGNCPPGWSFNPGTGRCQQS
jgi:hypothetical protein